MMCISAFNQMKTPTLYFHWRFKCSTCSYL